MIRVKQELGHLDFSRVPQNALAELQWICSAKVEFLTTVARAYMNGSFPGH
jgi:hypothetical protein